MGENHTPLRRKKGDGKGEWEREDCETWEEEWAGGDVPPEEDEKGP